MFCPYAEQEITMNKILDSYKIYEVRQAMLFAQMQSGKSGIFLGLAIRMLHEGLVDRVYILCGSNETELHDQLVKSWKKLLMSYSRENGLTEAASNSLKNAVSIHKSTGRKGLKKIPRDMRRSLVIWDESHFAQGVDNKPAEFLAQAEFLTTGSLRSHETWASRDCYFLSVSATPFAEFAATKEHGRATHKAIVVHKPADSYIGVSQLKPQLYKSFSIKTQPAQFKSLLEMVEIVDPKRYVLVRSRNVDVVQGICRELGFRCIEYTQGTKNNLPEGIDSLKEEPVTPTVICLKGMCKMGKVVPKRYIGMTFEETQTSNTDSVLQSFVGRMCGHTNNEEDPYPTIMPLIYVPEKMITGANNYSEVDRYIRLSNAEDILPVRAAHVAAPSETQAMRTGLFSTVPFVVPCNSDEDPEEYDAASALSDRFGALATNQAWQVRSAENKEYILSIIHNHLIAHPLADTRQQADLLNKLTPETVEFHNLHCYDYAEDPATGLEACATSNKHFDDKWTNADKYVKVYRKPGARLDALFIAARTELAEYETVLEQKNAMPTAEDTSVFTRDELVPATMLARKPVSHDVVLINNLLELEAFVGKLMICAGIHTAFIHKSLKGTEPVKNILKRVKTEGAGRHGKHFPKNHNRDDYMLERITIEVKITVEITVRVTR